YPAVPCVRRARGARIGRFMVSTGDGRAESAGVYGEPAEGVTLGPAARTSSSGDLRRLCGQWPVRRAGRTDPCNYPASVVARTVRNNSVLGVLLGSGVAAGHRQAAR